MSLQRRSIRGSTIAARARRRFDHHAASSIKDFQNPSTAAESNVTSHRPGSSAKERVAIPEAGGDFIGSEFAGRHEQYEKFYGGAIVPGEAELAAPMILPAPRRWWNEPCSCRPNS